MSLVLWAVGLPRSKNGAVNLKRFFEDWWNSDVEDNTLTFITSGHQPSLKQQRPHTYYLNGRAVTRREYCRHNYQVRKTLGVCIRCRCKATPGRTLCDFHLLWDKRRERKEAEV